MLIFINSTSTDESEKRRVYIKRADEPHLTTVFYPEQIGNYRNYLEFHDQSSTTPTNFKSKKTDFLLDSVNERSSDAEASNRISSMALHSDESFLSAPNHRKHYSEERLYTYAPTDLRPSGFKIQTSPQTPFPQIPKDYVRNVNSINDILEQVRGNDNDYKNMANGQGMRIEGTYKKYNDPQIDHARDMIGLQSIKNFKQIPATAFRQNRPISDPFYPYKPHTLSDINLLAVKQFRFAPFVQRTKHKRNKISLINVNDPIKMYNHAVAASENYQNSNPLISRKERTDQQGRKPFSLMLDVYPMNEDTTTATTTIKPTRFKRPFPEPMDIKAINNHLQYDHSYYNQIKFPQLQSYRVPHMQNFYDDMSFRRYMALQQNPLYFQQQQRPIQSEPNSNDRQEHQLQQENNPGKITVHLNLYPSRKSKTPTKVQSIEIVGSSDETRSMLFIPNESGEKTFTNSQDLWKGRSLDESVQNHHLGVNIPTVLNQNISTNTLNESPIPTNAIQVSVINKQQSASDADTVYGHHTTHATPVINSKGTSKLFKSSNVYFDDDGSGIDGNSGGVKEHTMAPTHQTLGPPTIQSTLRSPYDVTTIIQSNDKNVDYTTRAYRRNGTSMTN